MHTYLSRAGLVVAENSADERSIQAALAQLRADLVLTREVDRRHGGYVWKVHTIVSWAEPAVHVCDWRDERNRPLPLSSGLVELVRHRLSIGPEGLGAADRANAEREAMLDRDFDYVIDEASRDIGKRSSPAHAPLLHRGVHLRRSREKQRGRRR